MLVAGREYAYGNSPTRATEAASAAQMAGAVVSMGKPQPEPPAVIYSPRAAGTEEVGDGRSSWDEDAGLSPTDLSAVGEPDSLWLTPGHEGLGVRGEVAGDASVQPVPEQVLEAIQRYFPASEWERAACIVWRESRYKADEVSDTDDHGIFQVHQYADLERDGWAGWRPYFEALGWGWRPYEVDWNVRAAAHIWERNGWAAWTTHNGGDC